MPGISAKEINSKLDAADAMLASTFKLIHSVIKSNRIEIRRKQCNYLPSSLITHGKR